MSRRAALGIVAGGEQQPFASLTFQLSDGAVKERHATDLQPKPDHLLTRLQRDTCKQLQEPFGSTRFTLPFLTLTGRQGHPCPPRR